MVFSQYLFQPLYSLWWRILDLASPRRETVFYCHTPVDMEIWLPVQKYLKPVRLVSDKTRTRRVLAARGYQCGRLPAWPKAVIMCRVSAHKFPSPKVIKIGMNHGAYHFKRLTSARNYAPFSLFMFSSASDLATAKSKGISCGKAIGYPKLDPYLGQKPEKHQGKPLLVFSATYERSGMSAVQLWAHRLAELTERYEIRVTLHPWIHERWRCLIRDTPGVKLIEGDSPLPHIMESDVCISDTSSICGDICALDKPLITWILPPAPRTVPEVISLLENCSERVRSFEELVPAIERCLTAPESRKEARHEAARIFCGELNGLAGKRAAEEILKILPELRP